MNFYGFTVILLKAFFFIFYRHKIYGKENYTKKPCIIAANHASFYDPPLIAVSCPDQIHFLAREDLFRNFYFKKLIEALNAHPISKTQNISSIIMVSQLIKNQNKVVIFPEGQRSWDNTIGGLKAGTALISLKSNCPIQPVYIEGAFSAWPRMNKFPKLWGKTACIFGSPIYPEKYADLDTKKAVESINEKLKTSLEELKAWYLSGAQGSPP